MRKCASYYSMSNESRCQGFAKYLAENGTINSAIFKCSNLSCKKNQKQNIPNATFQEENKKFNEVEKYCIICKLGSLWVGMRSEWGP